MGRRIRVLAGLIGVLLAAGPAAASGAQETLLLSGTLAVGVGWTQLEESNDEPGDKTDDQAYPLLGASGSLSVPLGEFASLQFDLSGEHNFVHSSGDDNVTSLGLASAHLSWRSLDRWLVGAFAGGGPGRTERRDDQANATWIGLEGQLYLDDTTLYLQVARVSGDVDDREESAGPGTDENFRPGYLARGVGRYYPDDDTRLEAELSWSHANRAIADRHDMTVLGWCLRYDRRIATSPVHSFFVYRGARYDTTAGREELTEHSATLGLVYLFGAGSLRANDRRGAALDAPALPLRATAWVEPLD